MAERTRPASEEAASSVRERKLLELAFAFHVGIEGEYGCPGESCPGVQRLVAALAALDGVGLREDIRASRQAALSGVPEPFTENETKDVLTALYQDGHVDLVLADRVAALMKSSALSGVPPTPDMPANVQRLIDDLYFLFTEGREAIAVRFGDSRVIDDSCRANYAVEWLAAFISDDPLSRSPVSEQQPARP